MIKLVVFDIDGVMSDGKIIYSFSNNKIEEIKAFNVKDGLIISILPKLGIKSAIITGRESKIVSFRAKELGIDYIIQNSKDKLKDLETILQKEKIGLKEVAAIGDDLNDLKLLEKVDYSFCPNDANEEIKRRVKFVLSKNGGEGVVREMLEIVLKLNGIYKDFINIFS